MKTEEGTTSMACRSFKDSALLDQSNREESRVRMYNRLSVISAPTQQTAEEAEKIKSHWLKIPTATIDDSLTARSISAAKDNKMPPSVTTIKPMASRRSVSKLRRMAKRKSLLRSR